MGLLKDQIVEELIIFLENQGKYNVRVTFVDKFSENSECTHLTAVNNTFPFMFHVHYNDIVNVYEVYIKWLDTPESVDTIIHKVINSKDWYDKQFTNRILSNAITNIHTMAEIALEEYHDN